MAKVFIEETTLTAIGDAIRGKTGKTDLIDPANMSTEIAGIEAGGGGVEPPESAFLISGNCQYKYAGDSWCWFMDAYKNKIQTKDITNMMDMFRQDSLTTLTWQQKNFTEFPFVFNVKDIYQFTNAFSQLQLTESPKIRGTIKWSSNPDFTNWLSGLRVESFDDLFLPEMLNGYSELKINSQYSVPKVNSMFANCTKLTHIPDWWYKFKLNPESTAMPTYMYLSTYFTFNNCYSLQEACNLPVAVVNSGAALTSNQFYNTFNSTRSLSRVTFETNPDGSPITAQWKAQAISLNTAGYGYDSSYSDWYNSRYNHDSAVETINSLPDTSAYLASAGGTNTIQFSADAGRDTDGGACGNLTEEEIAVAAAKGWTVTFSI